MLILLCKYYCFAIQNGFLNTTLLMYVGQKIKNKQEKKKESPKIFIGYIDFVINNVIL